MSRLCQHPPRIGNFVAQTKRFPSVYRQGPAEGRAPNYLCPSPAVRIDGTRRALPEAPVPAWRSGRSRPFRVARSLRTGTAPGPWTPYVHRPRTTCACATQPPHPPRC